MTIHASKDDVPGSRFYLHARNQADALLFLLKIAFTGELNSTFYQRRIETLTYRTGSESPQRFHVVGEREVDNLEMAHMIADAVGEPLKYELVDFHSSRPGHDLRYALDGTKMKMFGWEPKVPLEESLKKTVEWTLAHDEWLEN